MSSSNRRTVDEPFEKLSYVAKESVASLRRRRSTQRDEPERERDSSVERPDIKKSRSKSRVSQKSDEGDKPKAAGCCASRDKKEAKTQQKGVFADSDAARAEMREDMGKREYDVADFYHKTGCAQAIAKNTRFAQFTLIVISINSLWIGVEMDTNDEENLFDAKWYFQAGEFFFCFFLSV
jgi:hypothetical protein